MRAPRVDTFGLVADCIVNCGDHCELVGQADSGATSDNLPFFMTGLFSTIDAMVDLPLEEALSQLALAPEIRSAILGDGGRQSKLLKLIVSIEQGDWPKFSEMMTRLGIEGHTLGESYGQAVRWTEDIFGNQAEGAA